MPTENERRLYARFYASSPYKDSLIDLHREIPVSWLNLAVDPLAIRVAARYLVKLADQPAGQRSRDNRLTKPINSPKSIGRQVVKDQARTEDDGHDETISPDRRDIQPKDVFTPKPRNMNVLNFVQTGKDQDYASRHQIPNDKGYDTVKNLSQYLVRTEGGGGTPAVGNKAKK
jgi:hypothetical protein